MRYHENSLILVISMVDLIGIDVNMSNITILRILSFPPSSGLTIDFSDLLLRQLLIHYSIPFQRAITRLNRTNLITQSFTPPSSHRKNSRIFSLGQNMSYVNIFHSWKFHLKILVGPRSFSGSKFIFLWWT